MKKSLHILLISIFILMLTGCAKHTAKSHADLVPSPSDDNITKREGPIELVFVCPFIDNEYWQSCIQGIEKADLECGTHTTIIGPPTIAGFPDSVPQYVEQAIEMHPDGIFLYAGLESLYPLIEKATNEGIPVLAIDSDAPGTSRVAYVGTDMHNLGYLMGRAAIGVTSGSAKVGYVCTTYTSLNEAEVFSAFKDTISDYKMEVIDTVEGGGDPVTAKAAVEKMMAAHPEIDIVFTSGAYNATGAARVREELLEQGESADFKIVGLDDTEENLSYLRKGIIDVLGVQSPEQMGYEAVVQLDEYIDNGKLASEQYEISCILVSSDNIDTYKMTGGSDQSVNRTVRVGYFSGDRAFQSGSNDSDRKSGYAYDLYQALAPIAGWKYKYVYGTRNEILTALINGDVDIVAGIYKTDVRAGQLLFSKMDLGLEGESRYFAVNPDEPELLNELDYAMQQLLQISPEFMVTHIQKYYKNYLLSQAPTDFERQYLDNKKVITLGYVKDNMPLCDIDTYGKPTGLINTLIDIMTTYMKVEIKAVCYDTMEDLEAAVRTDDLDVAFPIYSDAWVNEKKGLKQTAAFINDRMVIVFDGTYSDEITELVALSVTGMAQKDFISDHYPNSTFVYYDSRKATFDALKKGEVGCILGSANVLHMLMSNHPEYSDLNIVYTDRPEEIGMAVNDDDSLLAGIIDKAITSVDPAIISDSILKNSATEPVYRLRGLIQNNALLLVALISGFSFILLLVFIGYFRKSRIFNEEQARTNAALEDALVVANSANVAKTKFLSCMSHDIRTPMNAIIGLTTVATAHIDDKLRVSDCLEKIARSGKYLMTLINDVLDISKIESGNISLSPTAFSINDTVNTLINVVTPEVNEKNINFETNIHDVTHEMIYADEVRLNQIFINILNNAVKYTPEEGTVSLELFEEIIPNDDNIGSARITYIVKDTGIGMSDEFMVNMYETFTRANDSRVGKIQGTGLGLAIVKQMVDLMKGTIDCESAIGKGTKFTICLEFPLSEMGKEEVISAEREIANLHVLVAEDYELNWEVLHELLEMYNITADWVKDGQECVDKIRSVEPDTYDLILMDIQMPVMDGREATRIIRNDDNDYVKNIPIIAMTADAFSEDIADSISAGMNGHLSKPVNMDALLQEISKILGIGGGYEEE